MLVVRIVPAHMAVDGKLSHLDIRKTSSRTYDINGIPWSQFLFWRSIRDPVRNHLQAIYDDRHAPIEQYVGPHQAHGTGDPLSIRLSIASQAHEEKSVDSASFDLPL